MKPTKCWAMIQNANNMINMALILHPKVDLAAAWVGTILCVPRVDKAVVGFVEPIRSLGDDPLDRNLASALRSLARQKGVDPAKAETLVQEGLRQLRMLPREQRAATLKLLSPSKKEAP